MAVTRYSTQVDLGNLNSSHSLAILSVAPGSRVLDLGAADGSVARRLKERACTVCAVEIDAQAADATRQVCDRVINGDLESDDVWDALGDETFDVILALDVLEHLRQPERVLRRAVHHLAPGGQVVISVPNITHGAIRLSLLQGRFQYMELGPLDRTHLRFFDRPGAEQLVHGAGLVISERLRVSRALHETEVPVTTDGIAPELLETIARDPDATTYQFVFVARLEGQRAAPPSGAMLSERLLTELEGVRSRFAEVEQYARSLESDHEHLLAVQSQHAEELRQAVEERQAEFGKMSTGHDRAVEELTSAVTVLQHEKEEFRAELERRVYEAHRRQLELGHGKSELAVKQAFIDDLRQELQAEAWKFDARDREAREAAKATEDVATALQDRGDRLEAEVRGLRLYASSAGFRFVEGVIAGLKRVPFAFPAARAILRGITGDRPSP